MVTFNYTEEFVRQAKRLAKRYHSLADDINNLQYELMENPEIGVSLGGGKRKIRLGVKSKGGGKRGMVSHLRPGTVAICDSALVCSH